MQLTAGQLVQWGIGIGFASYVLFVVGETYGLIVFALLLSGLGFGLIRPGYAAAASLAVWRKAPMVVVVLVAADQPAMVATILGGLRTRLAERWDLIPADAGNKFCWIVDWPLFEFNEEEDRWDALHHPFTAPAGEFDPDNPGESRAQAYDLVWNGVEIGGGSIRISKPELQAQIFKALGISDEEASDRFGFLLDALKYGAPPHGGIAYGIDRFAALLAGFDSIRDVIAFPKTASGGDPLTGAPAPVDDIQLRDVGIELRKKKLPGQD